MIFETTEQENEELKKDIEGIEVTPKVDPPQPSAQDIMIAKIVNEAAIKAVDLQTKVDIFLKAFGAAMRTMRQNEPDVWKDVLTTTKAAYQASPTDIDIIVEMVAANTVEYGEALIDGKVTPFSAHLSKYASDNNLLFR